jgi:hypothetical protein
MTRGLVARRVSTALALLPFALAAGCGAANVAELASGTSHVRSSVLSTQAVTSSARPEGCFLDTVLDRSPERPFVVTGLVTTVWSGMDRRGLRATDAEALAQLHDQACRAGAHAVFQIRTAVQDQWIPRATSGTTDAANVFSRTVVATAVMAVYVRRDGSVMPPPEAPRRVIRVPTQLELQEGAAADAADEASMAWGQGITDPWAVPAD